MPEVESDPLTLSVRQLVAFTCRRGDLMGSAPGPSALEGIKAHSRLQKQRPEGSLAEHKIDVSLHHRQRRVRLGGRLDLLHPQRDPVLIEEIKTTYCPPENLPQAQRYLHWSQLKVYGYCYLMQCAEAADTVRLGMLWYDLLQGEVYREEETFDRETLAAFCLPLIDTYMEWCDLVQRQRSQLLVSAEQLDFPFADFRRGQRDLAVTVFRGLRDGGACLIEAPTGIGKTVSTLFPAVKALGQGHIDRLVYLTAKKQGREVVAECLQQLRRGGLAMTSLVLRAKNDMCACRTGGCELDAEGICPLRLGFYDRLPAARRALLEQEQIDGEAVLRTAAEHRLCAFELSLQLLPWVQFVVCDFNYVFDPLVGLTCFRDGFRDREGAEGGTAEFYRDGGKVGLLVDEAHNLVERSRDMYSVQLSRLQAQRVALLCKASHPRLVTAVKGVARALARWAKPLAEGTSVTVEKPATLTRAVEKLAGVMEVLAQQGVRYPDALGEWLPEIYRYIKVDLLDGEVYRTVTEKDSHRRGDIRVTRKCLDAGGFLAEIYKGFHGELLFSGTLRPFGFFQKALGLKPQTGYLSLPSPFSSRQQGVFICEHIDTRYKQREGTLAQILPLIEAVYRARAGNYLVFFPSYQYLNRVYEAFVERHPDIPVIRQEPDSGDATRERFLSHFQGAGKTLGFAIMGGIYGEGVDYVGDRLTGVIVVGVGLPQINPQQELIREHYQSGGFDGFDYAYRYPGMTRVLQTAGRVIRRETDRGIILLADQRFRGPFYRQLFPDHWSPVRCRDQRSFEIALNGFWQGGD